MSSLWTDGLANDIPDLTDAGIEAFFSCSSVSDASSQGRLTSMDSSLIGISQDSVAERRRHAIYFHRPPVWWSSAGPSSHLAASDGCATCLLNDQEICNHCDCRPSGSFSSILDQEHRLCQEVEAANADLLANFDSSTSVSDQDVPLLVSLLTSYEIKPVTLNTCKGGLEELRVRRLVRSAPGRDGNQVATSQNP